MIVYMPTLALVNSISFRQMQTPSKDFPLIRVLGTIGWIVAGFTISFFGWDEQGKEILLGNTFKMVAVASLLLGIFSLTLPNTPPAKKGQKTSVAEVLGLDALRLLKKRSYLFFFIASIAICIPLAFYYNFTNLFFERKRNAKNSQRPVTWTGFRNRFYGINAVFVHSFRGKKNACNRNVCLGPSVCFICIWKHRCILLDVNHRYCTTRHLL